MAKAYILHHGKKRLIASEFVIAILARYVVHSGRFRDDGLVVVVDHRRRLRNTIKIKTSSDHRLFFERGK